MPRLHLSRLVRDAEEARSILASVVSDLAAGASQGEGWSLAPTKRELYHPIGRTPHDRATIRKLAETMKPDDIAKALGIGRSSVYRALSPPTSV